MAAWPTASLGLRPGPLSWALRFFLHPGLWLSAPNGTLGGLPGGGDTRTLTNEHRLPRHRRRAQWGEGSLRGRQWGGEGLLRADGEVPGAQGRGGTEAVGPPARCCRVRPAAWLGRLWCRGQCQVPTSPVRSGPGRRGGQSAGKRTRHCTQSRAREPRATSRDRRVYRGGAGRGAGAVLGAEDADPAGTPLGATPSPTAPRRRVRPWSPRASVSSPEGRGSGGRAH